MKILITGGLGYVGSHVLVSLLEQNYDVAVIDNLSNSSIDTLNNVKKIISRDFNFYEVDLLNLQESAKVFKKELPNVVIHLAGLKSLSESVSFPLRYYKNNIQASFNVLELMDLIKCKNIIFSSSASVYGIPNHVPIKEDHEINPTNPYSKSKSFIESIILDWAREEKKGIILRFFNPVGAHSSGKIGEDTNFKATNIFPNILKKIKNPAEEFFIYGNKYLTRDGTCERDYIHIEDLSSAHLKILSELEDLKSTEIFNIGSGKGTTVLELIDIFSSITNKKISFEYKESRPGDVPISVASPEKIFNRIQWKTNFQITDAVKSSIRWENKKK